MPTAYFVDYPRRIEDLQVLHVLDQEKPYEIVRRVSHSAINYENFITDMVADRTFLEDTSGTGDGEVMRCVFVHRYGHKDGILVVPEYGGYVKWAAYIGHPRAWHDDEKIDSVAARILKKYKDAFHELEK